MLPLLVAQAEPGSGSGAEPGPLSGEAVVSVWTVMPGESVESYWGHTAIRVRDPGQVPPFDDLIFNYGLFDWSDPMFLPNFALGRLNYQVGTHPTQAGIDHYASVGRTVIEQDLALTVEERAALWAYLWWNLQPPQNAYRYRFLDDNCTTRVRDAVERAVAEGARIVWEELPGVGVPDASLAEPRSASAWEGEGRTYREYLLAYLAGAPGFGLLCDAGLGQPVEQVVDERESMFLPVPLMERFRAARVVDADGGERALVAAERRLVGPGWAWPGEAWNWPAWLAAGVLGVAVLGTGWELRKYQTLRSPSLAQRRRESGPQRRRGSGGCS